jgi:hypothetical protein
MSFVSLECSIPSPISPPIFANGRREKSASDNIIQADLTLTYSGRYALCFAGVIITTVDCCVLLTVIVEVVQRMPVSHEFHSL